jgi:hypothetical protein
VKGWAPDGFAGGAGLQVNERSEWPAVVRDRDRADASDERRTFPDD